MNVLKNVLFSEKIKLDFFCDYSAKNNVIPFLARLFMESYCTTPGIGVHKCKVFVKAFKTLLFPNRITDLFHLWYDDTYWSKILCSTIPTTLGHVKVKVTDLEFSC